MLKLFILMIGLNSNQAIKLKSVRMSNVKTPGMVLLKSSFNDLCQDYYMKNLDDIKTYNLFLQNSMSAIITILEKKVDIGVVKYNLKLEATYIIPGTEKFENRAFKTIARAIYKETCINDKLDEDFKKLLEEQEHYEGLGSGYTLDKIDGLLLSINKYSPIGGSSYIELPEEINKRKATINVQNYNDNMCFKYSILSKFVHVHPYRLSSHYDKLNDKYNFSVVTYPVLLKDVKIFEKHNPGVSINIYGIKKSIKTMKTM